MSTRCDLQCKLSQQSLWRDRDRRLRWDGDSDVTSHERFLGKWLVHAEEGDWLCSSCGHQIGRHRLGATPDDFRAGDVENMLATTEKPKGNVRKIARDLSQGRCNCCGKIKAETAMSTAPIFKSDAAAMLGGYPGIESTRNYLYLCGNYEPNRKRDDTDTTVSCHDAWCKCELTFVPVVDGTSWETGIEYDSRQWLSVSKYIHLNGLLVSFPTNPSHRAMLSRTRIMILRLKDEERSYNTLFHEAVVRCRHMRLERCANMVHQWMDTIPGPERNASSESTTPSNLLVPESTVLVPTPHQVEVAHN